SPRSWRGRWRRERPENERGRELESRESESGTGAVRTSIVHVRRASLRRRWRRNHHRLPEQSAQLAHLLLPDASARPRSSAVHLDLPAPALRLRPRLHHRDVRAESATNLILQTVLDEIRAHGPISFERYMELCLYHPESGYYTSPGHERFGRGGDYYTSAQLGTLFARLMSRRFHAMQAEMGGDFMVLEVGPGRGDFGREIAREFRYTGIEYGDPWPQEPIRGCIFSNEFFDALPVRAFCGDREVLV